MFGIKDVQRMRSWALKDSASNDTVGWNFVQHRDNEPLVKRSKDRLLTAIEASGHLTHLFLTTRTDTDQRYVWRESAIASYEATVQELLKRLCVLIHISGGQPIRESEFFEMTWRNTQRRRSITICQDRVMIHVKYHKGQQQTGRYKENIRFLAHPVGELLLDYIVYVLPLRQVFLRQQSAKALLSAFLWEKDNKVWSEGRLSQCLEDASVRARVPRLHVANWRQMTVAIVKTKFASHINAFETNDDDEDAEEMDEDIRAMTKQRNHKTRTVNRAYANQIGATFGNVFDGLIRTSLRASTLWQDFWGVETILKPKKRHAQEEESRLLKRVALGVYKPRKPWSADALLEAARKLYKDDCLEWKSLEQEQAMTTIMSGTEQVVCILPTGAGKSLLFMLPCILPDAGTTVLVVPLVALRGDLMRRMRELQIEHIEWLPGERRDAPLVIVSVEAAGTKDFCKYARVLIAQQKLDRIVVDECHLTVTAVEYRSSMIDMTAIRVLRTQFVYLTATLPPSIQAEFEERNHLLRPRTIRASSNRPNLFYMVRKASEASSGRGCLLQQCAAEARDAWDMSGLFDKGCDKIILYVRTRKEATELALMLECDEYTAGSGTEVEKREILERWIGEKNRPYIVATTALAEGLDYPHVRLVINVNEPESPTIFAQETGRAGRDGREAYSLVLLPSTWEAQDGTESTAVGTDSSRFDIDIRKGQERRAIHKYLRGEQCYRKSLGESLDVKEGRERCREGEVKCEVCQKRVESGEKSGEKSEEKSGEKNEEEDREGEQEREGKEGKERIARKHSGLDMVNIGRVREYRELSKYKEDLAGMKGICGLCRTTGDRWDHEFRECRRRQEVFRARREVREQLKRKGKEWIEGYKACFWCLNPQGICSRASRGGGKETERGGKKREREEWVECEFGEVVLPVCYGVWMRMDGRRWIEEEFGRKFNRVEEYMEWIGKGSEFGGLEAVEGVRVCWGAMREIFGR